MVEIDLFAEFLSVFLSHLLLNQLLVDMILVFALLNLNSRSLVKGNQLHRLIFSDEVNKTALLPRNVKLVLIRVFIVGFGLEDTFFLMRILKVTVLGLLIMDSFRVVDVSHHDSSDVVKSISPGLFDFHSILVTQVLFESEQKRSSKHLEMHFGNS